MFNNLKEIWAAKAQIIESLPVPLVMSFGGAAIGDQIANAPGMIITSAAFAWAASKVEDYASGRHHQEYTTFNSNDPELALQENGRIIARLSSPIIASLAIEMASRLG